MNNGINKLSKGNKNCRNLNLFNLLIICSILVFIISIGSIITKASDNADKTQHYKYYTSIDIDNDETLWNIENTYNNGSESRNIYINNIRKLNNMNSDTLYRGQKLIIYYYSDEVK